MFRTQHVRGRRSRATGHSRLELEPLEIRLCLAAGDLDPSFGFQFNGYNGRHFNIWGNNETNITRFRGLFLQSDGRFIAGGDPGRASHDLDVVRMMGFTANGETDASFGNQSQVFDISVSGRDFAQQPDGKFVIAGNAQVDLLNQQFIGVQRLLAGSMARDSSFGTGEYDQVGAVYAKINGDANAMSVVVQPDGKIVVLFGRPSASGFSKLGLVRWNPDGSIDNSFGTSGTLDSARGVIEFQPFASGFEATEATLVVLPDGKLMIGASTSGATSDFVLMRLATNGQLDGSFGNGGIVTTEIAGDDEIGQLLIQPDGKIIAVGKAQPLGGRSSFAVTRYLTSGALDTTWDGDGVAITSFPQGSAGARGVAIQPDGRLVVVGGIAASDSFGIVRYQTNGSPDLLFGTQGRATVRFPLFASFPPVDPSQTDAYNFQASRVAIQPDGKIIVLGDGFQGIGIARLQGITTEPGVFVTPSSGLHTSESRGAPVTASFTVQLATQPTSNVSLTFASSRPDEAVVTSSTLVFTPGNWNQPQTVTVAGQDDFIRDFGQTYVVSATVLSSDPKYSVLPAVSVWMVNDDDESLQMFRAYNPNANFHFFTTSRVQFDSAVGHGYRDEATDRSGFSVLPEHLDTSLPIYRLYHLARGFHYYTIDPNEKAFLLSQQSSPGVPGWRDEGVEGEMFSAGDLTPETVTIYRLYNKDSGVHLFTEDANYKNQVLAMFPNSWFEHAPLGKAYAFSQSAGAGSAGDLISAALFPELSAESSAILTVASDPVVGLSRGALPELSVGLIQPVLAAATGRSGASVPSSAVLNTADLPSRGSSLRERNAIVTAAELIDRPVAEMADLEWETVPSGLSGLELDQFWISGFAD